MVAHYQQVATCQSMVGAIERIELDVVTVVFFLNEGVRNLALERLRHATRNERATNHLKRFSVCV